MAYLNCKNQLDDPLSYYNYNATYNKIMSMQNRLSQIRLPIIVGNPPPKKDPPYIKYLNPILDDLTSFQFKMVDGLSAYKQKQKIVNGKLCNKQFKEGADKIMRNVLNAEKEEFDAYDNINYDFDKVQG
ncbi:MAG: hypothetical protein MJ252_25445, partial [archaeon]|nr:hypothetical protein [archaeon]